MRPAWPLRHWAACRREPAAAAAQKKSTQASNGSAEADCSFPWALRSHPAVPLFVPAGAALRSRLPLRGHSTKPLREEEPPGPRIPGPRNHNTALARLSRSVQDNYGPAPTGRLDPTQNGEGPLSARRGRRLMEDRPLIRIGRLSSSAGDHRGDKVFAVLEAREQHAEHAHNEADGEVGQELVHSTHSRPSRHPWSSCSRSAGAGKGEKERDDHGPAGRVVTE